MEKKQKVSLTKNELSIIKNILSKYPNAILFGSRIKGTNKKFSDLDICIKRKLSSIEHELLLEKFEKSNLPFKVDIVEYDKSSSYFKQIIDLEGIALNKL